MDGEPKIAFPSIKTTYFMDGNKVNVPRLNTIAAEMIL